MLSLQEAARTSGAENAERAKKRTWPRSDVEVDRAGPAHGWCVAVVPRLNRRVCDFDNQQTIAFFYLSDA